jgi:hypothetical protein
MSPRLALDNGPDGRLSYLEDSRQLRLRCQSGGVHPTDVAHDGLGQFGARCSLAPRNSFRMKPRSVTVAEGPRLGFRVRTMPRAASHLPFQHHVPLVLSIGSETEMGRIDTALLVSTWAVMQDVQAGRNPSAVRELPGDPVRAARPSLDREVTVATSAGALPDPALIRPAVRDFGGKTGTQKRAIIGEHLDLRCRGATPRDVHSIAGVSLREVYQERVLS